MSRRIVDGDGGTGARDVKGSRGGRRKKEGGTGVKTRSVRPEGRWYRVFEGVGSERGDRVSHRSTTRSEDLKRTDSKSKDGG